MRVLVVWCPDWSVEAGLAEAGLPSRTPAAVICANVVEVGNAAARAEGVRRGQRRRDAQSRCPGREGGQLGLKVRARLVDVQEQHVDLLVDDGVPHP